MKLPNGYGSAVNLGKRKIARRAVHLRNDYGRYPAILVF